jgi:hypothetical protein
MPAVAHGEQLLRDQPGDNQLHEEVPPPAHAALPTRPRHSGKPQSLTRIAAQFIAVHGARPISSVSARIGGGHGAYVSAPGVDHAAHVVASNGLLGRSVERSCRVRIVRRGRQAVFGRQTVCSITRQAFANLQRLLVGGEMLQAGVKPFDTPTRTNAVPLPSQDGRAVGPTRCNRPRRSSFSVLPLLPIANVKR